MNKRQRTRTLVGIGDGLPPAELLGRVAHGCHANALGSQPGSDLTLGREEVREGDRQRHETRHADPARRAAQQNQALRRTGARLSAFATGDSE